MFYRRNTTEGYVFSAMVVFVCCYAISANGRSMELTRILNHSLKTGYTLFNQPGIMIWELTADDDQGTLLNTLAAALA